MPQNVKISAKERKPAGSCAARRLRRDGWVPCALSLSDGTSRSIQLNRHDFETNLKRHGSDNLLAEIDVGDGKPTLSLLKDIQYDTVSDAMIHADFMEVSMTRRMRVSIAVRLVGDPVGVTQQEGVLEHTLREVEVECLPGDIVDSIPVDVSGLDIGGTVFVRDLKVSDKLTILTGRDIVIASVLAPVAEPTPEEAAAETGETPAEPELIGRKKEEEEEGGEEAGEEEGKAKPKEKAPEAEKEKEKGKGREK